MATHRLILNNMFSTRRKPLPKYAYEKNQRTDKINSYEYRLIDLEQGEIVDVKIPLLKNIPPQTRVSVINPLGTPYLIKDTNSGNCSIGFSIKADDIQIISDTKPQTKKEN